MAKLIYVVRAQALYSMVDGLRQGIFWLVGKKKIKYTYAGRFMLEERKKIKIENW